MRQSKYIIAAPDELYHFKYIKRVQGPDGKWRYYYGNQDTHRNIADSFYKAKGGLIIDNVTGPGRGRIYMYSGKAQSRGETARKSKAALADANRYTVRSTASRALRKTKRRVRDAVNSIRSRVEQFARKRGSR